MRTGIFFKKARGQRSRPGFKASLANHRPGYANPGVNERSSGHFPDIYREYAQGLKSVYNLKSGMKVLGASSIFRYVKFIIWALGGGKRKE